MSEDTSQGVLIRVGDRPVFANAALAGMLGYETPDQLVSLASIHEIVDRRDRHRIQEVTQRRIAGRDVPDSYVFRARRRDGSLVWLENRVVPTTWEGQPAAHCTIIDVSDRQRARNTLRLAAKVVSRASAQNNIESAVRVVLRWLGRGTGWQLAESWLPADDGRHLEPGPIWCRDQRRYEDLIAVTSAQRFQSGEGLPGRVWAGGQPEWVPDISDSPGIIDRDWSHTAATAGLGSACGIPIMAQNRTIAVLCFFRAERGTEKEGLLAALAGGAAPLGPVLLQLRTEQARQATLEQMEALIFQNADGILVLDEENCILFSNPAAEKTFGRSREALQGMPFGMPTYSDDIMEVEIRDAATGRSRVSEMQVAAINWKGRPAQLVSLRDVTQRIEARRALDASHRRLQDFAEAASDWLWEMDEDLRFTYFSDRIEVVMGQPVSHWIGKRRHDITPEQISCDPKWAQHLEDLKARRPFKHFRYRITLPDGNIKHVSISGIPVFDEQGRFRGYRGTGSDETREVEARQRASESDRRLSNIADRLPGIVFQRLLKPDGSLEYPYMSAKVSDLLGWDTRDIEQHSRRWLDIVLDEDRPRFDAALAESSRSLEPMDVEFRIVTGSGDTRWFWHRSSEPRRLENGDILWDCIELDITHQKKTEEQVRYLGYYDQLTDLPNRTLFAERVDQMLHIASRTGETVAVAMLDLKRFKKVNEEFGLAGGDEVLRQAAARFKDCLRPGDTVARLGGDRFLLLLPSVDTDKQTQVPLRRLMDAMEEPFTVNQNEIMLGFNMGIALFPRDGDNAEELIRKADSAQVHYRRWGPGIGYTFFHAKMVDPEAPGLVFEKDLRDAIESEGQLEAHFQPIYEAETGRLIAVETLARWTHPDRGAVSPGEFIPIAEQTGLIHPLGLKILQQACSAARQWEAAGMRPVEVGVNLSAEQIRDPGLGPSVRKVVEETGMAPERLVLEVTESSLIADLDRATRVMQELGSLGVRFALDDFGVGYSSLSYLGRLPVQALKVDRSFVHDLQDHAHSEPTIKAAVALAHALDLHVVAEGVETREQLERVKRLGCDTVQGFLLGKPMPACELQGLLSGSDVD